MSTIVVNPGDVIVVSDSIAVKMSKVTEILQSVVKGAETTGPVKNPNRNAQIIGDSV